MMRQFSAVLEKGAKYLTGISSYASVLIFLISITSLEIILTTVIWRLKCVARQISPEKMSFQRVPKLNLWLTIIDVIVIAHFEADQIFLPFETQQWKSLSFINVSDSHQLLTSFIKFAF